MDFTSVYGKLKDYKILDIIFNNQVNNPYFYIFRGLMMF